MRRKTSVLFRSSIALAALLVAATGCNEFKKEFDEAGVESTSVRFYGELDESGSVVEQAPSAPTPGVESQTKLGQLGGLLIRVLDWFANRPRIEASLFRMGGANGRFFNGPSYLPEIRKAIDVEVNTPSTNPPGTHTLKFLRRVNSDIDKIKDPACLYLVVIASDGGFSDSTKEMRKVCSELAKKNVIVAVVGVYSKPGTNCFEIVEEKMQPLLDAQKLSIIQDSSIESGLKALQAKVQATVSAL